MSNIIDDYQNENNNLKRLNYCPISDTEQCYQKMNDKGRKGPGHYWSPEDYHNFARAFLRT